MARQPVLLGLTLCDYVIVEERTKKISLIGAFTGLGVPAFPALANPFSVFATLTDGDGDVTIRVDITHLELNEVIVAQTGILRFPDPVMEVSFHLRLRECEFPAAGLYNVALLTEGELVAQRRIRIDQRESDA